MKEYIIEKTASLIAEISLLTKNGLTNNNLHCEYLVKCILNIVNEWNLINLNTIQMNYPSIDLGDFVGKIAVQVTSTKSSKKIDDTLRRFFDTPQEGKEIKPLKLYEKFNQIYIFILGTKQKTYTLNQKKDNIVKFDEKEHILDLNDVIEMVYTIDDSQLIRLYNLFVCEFEPNPNYIASINEIKKQIQNSLQNNLTKLNSSNKYIPDIFVETKKIKDLFRYFSIPKFYNKAIESIDLDLIEEYNVILTDLDLDKLKSVPNLEKPDNSIKMRELAKTNKVNLFKLKQEIETKRNEIEAKTRPWFKQEPTPKKAWKHTYSSLINHYFLSEPLENLEAVLKRVLILTSVAGRGKTNFLCDFVENVILPREMYCMFVMGSELNSCSIDNIGDFITRRVFMNQHFDSINKFLEFYNKVYEMTGKYLLIVIDGINEVSDLKNFPSKLTYFIEEILEYDFIKVIMSCRTEYYEDRFNCFRESRFTEYVKEVKDFDKYMTDIEHKTLFEGYLKHFNIVIEDYSERVYDSLTSNPLFLRIFCEAYHTNSRVVISNLMSLNKLTIFEKYYKLKRDIYEVDQNKTIKLRKHNPIFKNVISKLVENMLANNTYVNLVIDNLCFTEEELVFFASLINEDIMIRRDLGDSENSYCFNFTYDEFRDFLIAKHLVEQYNDIDDLDRIFNLTLTPNNTICEGVQRFIYHFAKTIDNKSVLGIIKKYNWYNNIFIEEVFELEDRFIDEDDIERIKDIFMNSSLDLHGLILKLIQRNDIKITPKLNRNTLLEIVITLNEERFEKLFNNLFCYNIEGQGSFYTIMKKNKIDTSDFIKHVKNEIAVDKTIYTELLSSIKLIALFTTSTDFHLRDKAKLVINKSLRCFNQAVSCHLKHIVHITPNRKLASTLEEILKDNNYKE